MGQRGPLLRGIAAVAVLAVMVAAALALPAGAAAGITLAKVKKTATTIANSVVGSQAIPNTVVYRRSDPVTVGPNNQAFGAVACPSGYVAVGGGHVGTRIDNWPSSSYPGNATNLLQTGTTGWQVFLTNASAGSVTFRVYVICLKANADINYPVGVHPL